jgi:hypothetical protein
MLSHPLTIDYLDLNGEEEFVKLEINNPDNISNSLFDYPMVFEGSPAEQAYLASTNRYKLYFFGGRL